MNDYDLKVAIFTNYDKSELEKDVNEFIKTHFMISSQLETDVIPIYEHRDHPTKFRIYYTIYITYQ